MNFDLGHVARDLGLSPEKVQRTVQMLDEGNTVPFITRYRKDQTGGLDEELVREIQDRVAKLRLLQERKAAVLKSIEAQGKLTPELAHQINHADSLKRVEDLYLPYKLKKQTLATKAREQGLEPLANELLEGHPDAADLNARAAALVDAEKGLASVDDVLQGVGYLVAERFSERADVRGRLRRLLWRTGKLVSTRIEPSEKPAEEVATAPASEAPSAETASAEATPIDAGEEAIGAPSEAAEQPAVSSEATEGEVAVASSDVAVAEATSAETASTTTDLVEGAFPSAAPVPITEVNLVPIKSASKRKKKKKKKETAAIDAAFKDYFNYQEPLSHIPPHRVLAINRGERAKVLRVRIDCDIEAMYREVEPLLAPPEHPHADFLRKALGDALDRLIVPSLEREARREMTEKAEHHAVDVFIRNLRKLLLQPPVHGRRVLAIDPGFKSGCKLAALDEFGNVLGHAIIHVVGNEERRKKGREQLVDLLRNHEINVVAIGNGTACREAETLVADIISSELAERDIQYTIVNEAGASVYSTSPIGREEFPGYDPLLRSAISIGRRLLDPLSELVKINPANIGVGMYQHDVKAKHLRDSLDAVVESAVNYVGVDVNTASPALLRYVSGLNHSTARKLYEYRVEHGPFKSREQFKEVSGFGDATFVQAAGFLKIFGGDEPLDATWIHPESYQTAERVLEHLHSNKSELARIVPVAAPPKKAPPLAKAVEQVTAQAEVREGSSLEDRPADDTPESGAATGVGTDLSNTEAALAMEQAAGAAVFDEALPASAEEAPPAEAPSAVAAEQLAEASEASAPPTGPTLAERAAQADAAAIATQLEVGELLTRDILQSLGRPGRDPREDLPPPIFRRGIMKLEDLQAGMELQGTVLNVVDFGAFVDIGLSDSGLVHISRLADRYVRDPHEVVGVGDVLKVWVVEVDKQRRRVSLTAIQPGTERPPQPKREKRERPQRPRRPQGAPQQGPPQQGAPPQSGERRPPRQNRPPRPQPVVGAPAEGGATGTAPPPAPSRPSFRGGGGGGGMGGTKGPRDPAPTVGSKKMLSKQLNVKKKVKPKQGLTKAMEEGREAMKSFGDLLQFMKKKDSGDEKK